MQQFHPCSQSRFTDCILSFAGLLSHYGTDHPDSEDVRLALQSVRDVIEPHEARMRAIENQMKLIELQRDLVGLESNLVAMNRVRCEIKPKSLDRCKHTCTLVCSRPCLLCCSNSFARVVS